MARLRARRRPGQFYGFRVHGAYDPAHGHCFRPRIWMDAGATTVGIRLSRDELKDLDGACWELLVLFNPHDGDVPFSLPDKAGAWTLEIDTARPRAAAEFVEGSTLTLAPRSLVLLR